MSLQPGAEQRLSLEDLDVAQEGSDGELTSEQRLQLEEFSKEVDVDSIPDEEKRLVALVEAMDATDEQKEELKHQVKFLFFSTTFTTVLMTIASIDAFTRPLFETKTQMPPMAYIAMGIIISYLLSIGVMKFSKYSEAKSKLREAEEKLMDFAQLMGITGNNPKEVLQRTVDTGETFKRKKRAEKLAVEIASKKKKPEEPEK